MRAFPRYIKSTHITALLIVLLMAFAGCSDDTEQAPMDDVVPGEIPGSWYEVGLEGYEKYSGPNGDVLNEFSTVFPEGAVTYTFDPGGGLMIVRNVNTDMAQTRYGEWHLEGNRLTIFEEGNEQSYTTTVIKLTATELVTEYRSANVEDGYELYEKNTYIRKQVEELPPAILH